MTENFSDGELQSLWDEQPINLTITNTKELIVAIKHDYRREQRRLFFLNVQEVTPALGMVAWGVWNGLRADSNAWAWFVAALASLGVGLFLAASSVRQRRFEQTFDATTRGELERSRSQMRHRADLYRTVAWWYLAPCAVAIVMMLIANGVDFTAPFTIGYLLVGAGFGAGLYRWNRKIGQNRYEPEVERLSRLIADLG